MKQCFSFLCGLLCFFYIHTATATPFQPLDQMIQWELTDTSPFTEQAGYTPWQSFNGGQARFVSCSAGIPQNAVLLTGLQIIPQADVRIQKPTFSTDFAAKETKFLYPIQDPFTTNTTPFYTGDVLFFPIIFHLNDTHQEIQIPLNATLPLVTPNGSHTENLSFNLSLKSDGFFSTPICAALMNTLQRVPEPAGQHVSGTLTQSGENTLDLNLSFDFMPTRVFAQLEEQHTLKLTQIHLKNKTAFLQFETDTPLSLNTPLNFHIITDKGWFHLPLTITANTTSNQINPPVVSLLPLLILLFFSPFWITLFYLPQNHFRQITALLGIATASIFFSFKWMMLQTAPAFLIYPSVLQCLLALFTLLFFLKTARSGFVSWPILILLLTPFPFLISHWAQMISLPFQTQFFFLLLQTITVCFPLIIGFLYPSFVQRLKALKKIPFFRLPFLFLCLWLTLLLLIIPINNRLPLYQKPAQTDYSLVVYTHPTAWSTFWQTLMRFPFNPYRQWEKQNKLTLYRGHLLTPPAPQNTFFPTYLLMDKTGNILLTIEHPVSNDQLISYLKNILN